MTPDAIARNIAARFSTLLRRAGLSYASADDLVQARSRGHARQIALALCGVPTLVTLMRYAPLVGASVLYLEHGVGAAPSDDEIVAAVKRARKRLGLGGRHAAKVTERTSSSTRGKRSAGRPRSSSARP